MKKSWFTLIRLWLSAFSIVTVPLFLFCTICNAYDFLFVDQSQIYDMGGRELGIFWWKVSFVINIPLIVVWTIFFSAADNMRPKD